VRVVCAVALALCGAGCTIGRFYNGAPLRGDPSALAEGRSTKADVLRLFGPPTQITHQTDGDTFMYLYRKQNSSSLRLQDPITGISWFTYSRLLEDRDTLVVLFDFNGIVRAVAVEHRTGEMPAL
jgi:outer membrane protein assembly factor BamE (lipoprotein component of BamABCDE complex)